MKRRSALVVALLTVVCVLCGLVACKNGTGKARVLANDEKTLVLCVDEAKGSVSLLALMEKPVSKGALAQRFDKILKLAEELGEDDAK